MTVLHYKVLGAVFLDHRVVLNILHTFVQLLLTRE